VDEVFPVVVQTVAQGLALLVDRVRLGEGEDVVLVRIRLERSSQLLLPSSSTTDEGGARVRWRREEGRSYMRSSSATQRARRGERAMHSRSAVLQAERGEGGHEPGSVSRRPRRSHSRSTAASCTASGSVGEVFRPWFERCFKKRTKRRGKVMAERWCGAPARHSGVPAELQGCSAGHSVLGIHTPGVRKLSP
jgi:hypothetical protein